MTLLLIPFDHKRGKSQLIPPIEPFAVKGRPITIVFHRVKVIENLQTLLQTVYLTSTLPSS
jgi:hypothetical protein